MNLACICTIFSFASLLGGNSCSSEATVAPEPTKHVTFRIRREHKRYLRFKKNEMDILRLQIQKKQEGDALKEPSRSKTTDDLRMVQ